MFLFFIFVVQLREKAKSTKKPKSKREKLETITVTDPETVHSVWYLTQILKIRPILGLIVFIFLHYLEMSHLANYRPSIPYSRPTRETHSAALHPCTHHPVASTAIATL